MKKIGLVTLALLAFGWLSASAETIKGNVIDANGEAMPFVTISVLTQDSTLITGAITDDNGNYAVSIEDLRFKIEDLIIQAS